MRDKTARDYLWLVFFLIVFINGFEAGGYQASLLNIGRTYELSSTSKGFFASVELFATMLAPLILGAWADRSNKLKCLKILLSIQFIAALIIIVLKSKILFLGGIFFLGLTTSALQFISIAALSDYFPVSSKKKIGYLTSMYALGAFVAPLAVSAYLRLGYNWRTLFVFVLISTLAAVIGITVSKDEVREAVIDSTGEEKNTGSFYLTAIILLCLILAIYVGYENGFAFFVDTLFAEEFHSAIGKYALSVFWIIMIPSRVLAGHKAHHSYRILVSSIIAIPLITGLITLVSDDVMVLILCIPLGFFCGMIYPCVLNLAIPMSGNHKATATGMLTTATGIGGVVFTAITGYLGDLWNLRVAVMALSSFFIISLISVVLFLGQQKKYNSFIRK
jgi:MFS family permease